MDHSSDSPHSPPGRQWPLRSGRLSSRPPEDWHVTGFDDQWRPTRRRDATDRLPAAEDTDGSSDPVDGVDGDGSSRDSDSGRDDGGSTPRTRLAVDSLMTSTDDRQVLVVGAGVAGLAVTATLRRTDYDPVLLTEPGPTHASRLAILHPVGRALLDDLTADTLRAADTDVVRLDAGAGRDGPGPAGEYQSVALPTDALADRLGGVVPEEAVRAEGVRTVERERSALRVRFESGVREWFDLVVAADGPGSTVREIRGGSFDAEHTVQVEARLDAEAEPAPAPRAVWTDQGFVQTVPHPQGGSLVRLTGPAFAADDNSPEDRVHRAVEALGRPELGPAGPTAVRRTEVAQSPPDGGHWSDGRVAYCGGAALSQAPATGLGATLALADARVFADELLAGPSAVDDAIAAYGRRRRRHLDRFREVDTGGSHTEAGVDVTPALASVRRFRSANRVGDDLLADADGL
jgi:2-polyprenyl-6-methoxyphenol hydroxylase-like FAD-dependent oxidoreductase